MVLGSFIDPTGHWDQVSKPDQNRLLKSHILHRSLTCGIDRITVRVRGGVGPFCSSNLGGVDLPPPRVI